MRLFAAIEIDPAVREELAAIQKRLSPHSAVRWSPPQNLHLTLRFYGSWPKERLAELEDSLAALEQPAGVQVDLGKLSFFPNERAPRAPVVVVDPADDLLALQERIEAAAQELGFKRERRAYTPHITLGRIRHPKGAAQLVKAVRAGEWKLGAFRAQGFALFASETTPAGSIYRKVTSF